MRVDSTAMRRGRGDSGANLVEYAFLVALIALVCLAAVNVLGENNSKSIDTSADSISTQAN
jgi:Flp pilus assembly pilin Flp